MLKQNNSIFQVANSRVSIEDIYTAEKKLQGIIKKTELIESPVFSNECGNFVFIKPENLQVTGAFKIRGAFNKLSKLSDEEKSRGVIASSAGNHAQGIGYAAQLLGIKATVVMPATTPIIKVEATRNYGTNVVLYGDSYDEAYKKARELETEHNYVFVHPFDDLDVILGQGTVALEILNQLEDVDEILVPIGGGGLASGIAFAAKMLKPSIRIIGVEPEGACCMKKSLSDNKVIELEKVDTIADGAAVKKPGTLTFEFIKEFVDEVITVSDFDIAEAILLLIEKHKLITEGAGATINLPDKPGELLHVAKIISELNANVIKLDHNQSKVMDSFKQVQLEVTVETNGHSHVEEIEAAFQRNGIEIQKIY
ncbi:MAG: threonine dehydratase [Firmicutes bacterium]|nr:threonine dehydratase [Bacillota bacterium]